MNRRISKPTQMDDKIDWGWSNSPILLPLAYEHREWNSIYSAFITAEYSGSKVIAFHVKTEVDDKVIREKSLKSIDDFASCFNVNYEIKETRDLVPSKDIAKISDSIASAAKDYECQAIVMSAYKEGFFRKFFGRISDRVARKADCDVVLVETPRAGMSIPKQMKKIMVPILKDRFSPAPLILAAAFTSSASIPYCELIVARIVNMPLTTSMDAIESTKFFRRVEGAFSQKIAVAISSLGRLFSLRLLAVRDVGVDVAEYAKETEVGIIIMESNKPSRLGPMMTKEEYAIVERAPCITLVVFPAKKVLL
ncbi:MAG: universal stress protein [archaeon]|nr:universal stress protein [archaeon]